MTITFAIAKCKTKAAFSAKPRQPIKLDLTKIKNKFKVILETPILLVIKEKDVEIIVHSHGEIFFKECSDTDLMDKIAKEIYEIGLKGN